MSAVCAPTPQGSGSVSTSGSLPRGFVARLATETKSCDGGTTLIGTTTGRLLHLKAAAAQALDGGRVEVVDGVTAALARLLLDRDLAHPSWDRPGVDDEVRDVTVVVPVRDRAGQLGRLLAALPAGVATVVVDDGSLDEVATARLAREFGARLVRHPSSRGPAAARNSGLGEVTTPYAVFVDSDVVPVPGWLGTLRRHFDDPRVGIVAPRVLGIEQADDATWLHRYEAVRSSLDLGPTPAAVHPHGRVAYLPSAALMVRCTAYGSGFDESLHVAEDVDLVWRTHEAGWRVRYEPAALVRHEHRTDVSHWLSRKAFYGTGAALLAARHGEAVAPMVLAPWTAALTTVVLAQRRWSLPVAAAICALTTLRISRRLSRSSRPVATAATLTAVGAVATLHQTAAALTRHYWPLAVAAALVSRRARRALLVAAVVDGLLDHRRTKPDLDPLRYLAARRLDDLGYGAGVWLGAFRGRSVGALRPALRGFDFRH